MSAHPGIDMMSFTGSTRAGILVAEAAAGTVKRVHQELGGKSANILLEDADFATAVGKGVMGPASAIAARAATHPPACSSPPRATPRSSTSPAQAAAGFVVGDPRSDNSNLGPVVSKVAVRQASRR